VNKTRVLVSMMLTVLLVAAMGVIPVAASPASNGAGEPGFSLMSVTPIVVGDDWYATSDVPPAFFWGAGEPVFSDSGPFQFECEYPVVVDVTDDFQKGDQFRIYDNGSPIGETSAVPVIIPVCKLGRRRPLPTQPTAVAASGCPPGRTPSA
jgi:hypothetical protein